MCCADARRGSVRETIVDDEAIDFLAARAEGDARTALNALELADRHGRADAATGRGRHDRARAGRPAAPRAALRQGADQHYDYISALIKSMRGSDPDAALYYLAVMLEGGEDPRYLVRRMVILASEDIGNADPHALTMAGGRGQPSSTWAARGALRAQPSAAICLALAPKSNAAARAIWAASAHVREHGAAPPPDALRSGSYPGAAALGRGVGYDYPHDHPGHVADQELLPESVAGERFYQPDEAEARAGAASGRDPTARWGREP